MTQQWEEEEEEEEEERRENVSRKSGVNCSAKEKQLKRKREKRGSSNMH